MSLGREVSMGVMDQWEEGGLGLQSSVHPPARCGCVSVVLRERENTTYS